MTTATPLTESDLYAGYRTAAAAGRRSSRAVGLSLSGTRSHRWADWPDIRSSQMAELRALVALCRRARGIAARRSEPLTAHGYHDWQAR